MIIPPLRLIGTFPVWSWNCKTILKEILIANLSAVILFGK